MEGTVVNPGVDAIIKAFENHLQDGGYPCVAAKAALSRGNLRYHVASHFGCPYDDVAILHFLYDFITRFRSATNDFHSAIVIFRAPEIITEELFDTLLWQRLQCLSELDARHFVYDKRVSADPSAPDFSFSIGEEAFFIIGLHPASARQARRFRYPALVFNPHAQFEALRRQNRYEKMKRIVRERDIAFSGSTNPMLGDFGEASEANQYSGRHYDLSWRCPLKVGHANGGPKNA